MEAQKIGFWKNPSGTAEGLVEITGSVVYINCQETKAILAYIKAATIHRRYRGYANCRKCGKRLGSCDMITSDGKFIFPQKYEHYILKHGVRPPDVFIVAAKKQTII